MYINLYKKKNRIMLNIKTDGELINSVKILIDGEELCLIENIYNTEVDRGIFSHLKGMHYPAEGAIHSLHNKMEIDTETARNAKIDIIINETNTIFSGVVDLLEIVGY